MLGDGRGSVVDNKKKKEQQKTSANIRRIYFIRRYYFICFHARFVPATYVPVVCGIVVRFFCQLSVATRQSLQMLLLQEPRA